MADTWIAVEERLPEMGEEVLVQHRHLHPEIVNIMQRSEDGWSYLSVFGRGQCWWFTKKVPTHWRPTDGRATP